MDELYRALEGWRWGRPKAIDRCVHTTPEGQKFLDEWRRAEESLDDKNIPSIGWGGVWDAEGELRKATNRILFADLVERLRKAYFREDTK